MHALVYVTNIDRNRPHAYAAGIVDGPRAFHRAVQHSQAEGFTLARIDRRRGKDTNHAYAVARLEVRDGCAVIRTREVTLEMCDAPRKQIEHIFNVAADPIAPYVA